MKNKSPSRKVNEIDNRGSHFYLALYWAEALQSKIGTLICNLNSCPCPKSAGERRSHRRGINDAQGNPVDLGGYYYADDRKGISGNATKRDIQSRPCSFE